MSDDGFIQQHFAPGTARSEVEAARLVEAATSLLIADRKRIAELLAGYMNSPWPGSRGTELRVLYDALARGGIARMNGKTAREIRRFVAAVQPALGYKRPRCRKDN